MSEVRLRLILRDQNPPPGRDAFKVAAISWLDEHGATPVAEERIRARLKDIREGRS